MGRRDAKRSWRRRAWRVARGALFVWLAVMLIMSMLQEWLIFPGRTTQGQRHAVVRPAFAEELIELSTADGDAIVALFGAALLDERTAHPDAGELPTMIWFYGNGMCLADAIAELRAMRRLGINAVGVEFPGYGMSGGDASEKSFYAAADAVYDHVVDRDDVDGSKIIAGGWSLGAAVAVDLAHRRDVIALAIFSPFTSLKELGKQKLPLLPISLALRHDFDSLSKIHEIDVPTFVSHGTDDSIIPHGMSRKLAAAAAGPVTSVDVESDHNDLFVTGGEGLMRAFGTFLDALTEDD